MSSEAQVIGVGDSEPHAEFQESMVAAHPANSRREGASLRFVAEPCAKHAEKPPGEQTWNDDEVLAVDAEGNPIPGAVIQPATKKRDPNGFVHGCPECESAAHVVKEA